MNILMIDTSTDTEIVLAVTDDGSAASIQADAPRHSRMLISTIDRVLSVLSLQPADLDMILCGTGPGSFTGLRIGIVTARTFSQVLNVPATAFPSHELYCCRSEYINGDRIIVAFDAKKNRVYGSVFELTEKPLVFNRLFGPGDCSFEIMKGYINDNTYFAGDYFLKNQWTGRKAGLPQEDLCACYARKTAEDAVNGKLDTDYRKLLPLYCRKSDAETARDALTGCP